LLGCAVTSLQLDQSEVAIELCDQLLALNEDHLGAYQVKGEAYQKEGLLPEAKRVFEQALTRNEHEEAIYLKLIEICYLLTEYSEATYYLDQLVSLDGEQELANEWKNRLLEMGET